MKPLQRSIAVLLCLLTISIVSTAHALTPGHLWSQRFGAGFGESGRDVLVTPTGDILMLANFGGTVNFGGSSLISAGVGDVALAKYSSTGAHMWSIRFGGTANDNGEAIDIDPLGNIYVTGYFNGTANFGGANLISAGSADIFLAKYDANGVHQWSQRFGGTAPDVVTGIAVDQTGQVSITGYFTAIFSLGGANLIPAGGSDIFLASYTSNGVYLWSQKYGGSTDDVTNDLVADSQGRLTMTGYFNGTVNFGGVGLPGGTNDIVLAQYNSGGVHQWSQRFGSNAGTDIGYSLAIGPADGIYLAGRFDADASFGGTTVFNAGGLDILLARYTSAGAHIWSLGLGGLGNDYATAVAADAASNVALTGVFEGSVNFGDGNLVSAGGTQDIFIARYTFAGNHSWALRAGSTDVATEAGYGIDTDPSGNVIATGQFNATANFGGADLVSGGISDIFLVKYDYHSQQSIIKTIKDIGNDQGRQVNIRFERSGEDGASSLTPILSYEVYRREKPAPSLVAGDGGTVRADGWTQVGAVPAHRENTYGIVVPTIGDSTLALGQYYSAYYVRAATSNPGVFFDSPPDSGYSLDNLAPAVPQNFVYDAGDLSWNESTADDFDFFTVYGSNTDSFGAATVVDYSIATAMDVSASPYVYYYVTATDFSGNEGKAAKINSLSGVGGTPRSYVLSVSNYPNPFNPRTTVSYTVPSRGRVTISIYDASGARVATLFNGERAAGAYSVDWDGRTEDAAVAASGVYFARIEHNGAMRSKKMVLLK